MCTVYDHFHSQNIPLQFQIKQELHGGLCPLDPLPGLCPGPTADLDGPRPLASLEKRP